MIFFNTVKRIAKNPLNWLLIIAFPLVFAVLILAVIQDPSTSSDKLVTDLIDTKLGIVDLDGSSLSGELAKQLGMSYNVTDTEEGKINTMLSEQELMWILVIREGYERDVLAGKPPVLEGYSLMTTDVSALASVSAENITRSFMTLGTTDQNVIEQWTELSEFSITTEKTGDNMGLILFFFGFFGFICLMTAFFVVKSLAEEKRKGMTERIGVLPITSWRYLGEGIIAAFVMIEVTVILTFVVIIGLLGSIPNPVHLFILLSVYNLFCVGMSLAAFSLLKSFTAAGLAMTIIGNLFSMVGGLFWPIEITPPFMQKLAWFSPCYWLSKGLNNIREITFDGFVLPILFLFGFSIVVFLTGGWKRIQAEEN